MKSMNVSMKQVLHRPLRRNANTTRTLKVNISGSNTQLQQIEKAIMLLVAQSYNTTTVEK